MKYSQKKVFVAAAISMAMGNAFAGIILAGYDAKPAPLLPAAQPTGEKLPVVAAHGVPAVDASSALPVAHEIQRSNNNGRRKEVDLTKDERPVAPDIKILQIGVPAEPIPLIKGFGRDVTVREAIRQIVPDSFSVFTTGDVDFSRRTSWRGGSTWLGALNDLGTRNGLSFTVDWAEREVTVQPEWELEEEDGKASQPASVSAPNPSPKSSMGVAAKTYQIKAGETLRGGFRRLLSSEGWHLAWDAEEIDYRIDVPITLKGSLVGNQGVLTQILEAYRDADDPLEIEFKYANKTAEVRPMSYKLKGAK